ncbi:MAG: PSD1 and planctomycete cytochrome C domain-containing protein [Fimbriiglobus sp.]|nr:PSD1 and planctomycete cytochrome C domain-containing protein [Fimbriiglobus sp.]
MPRLSITSFVLLLVVSNSRADGDPNAVSFEKHVLPVLQAKCFSCHDAKKARSDLRLDVRAKAFAGGETGKKGIVPGKSDESEIYRRVASKNEKEVMPPKGEKLTAKEAADLKAWIDAGAKWPDALSGEEKKTHWAFVAPKRPELPVHRDPKGSAHPIDLFVRAKLESTGLKPSPPAEKHTLLRRVYLDLIGLPPTPAEVDAFVNDPTPDAYEKVVEKLLASKHYGERWARLWLDAARYADSDGYEKDKPRFVHFYRDWVIDAFIADLPYDQFVQHQLAGDLLPNATQAQKVATGFLRNSMINEEGGADPEQFRMEAMFDRMDAVGKAVLGLTIQCAQCHTHKFDPLTHTEYYRLFAFLNTAHEASATVYTADAQAKRADLFRQMAAIDDELKHKTPDWKEKMRAWEKAVRAARPTWTTHKPELDGSGGQKNYLLDDGSILAAGYAPTKSTDSFTGQTKLKTITAVRLEMLNDPSLPHGGPGRSLHGTFGLTEIAVEVAGKKAKIVSAIADANPPEAPLDKQFDDKSNRKRVTGPIEFAFDGKDETAWTNDIGPGRSNTPRTAVFVFDKPLEVPANAKVTVRLTQNHGGWNSDDNQSTNLGRFRISFTDAKEPKGDLLPQWVGEPTETRNAADEAAVFAIWRATVPEWKDAHAKIEALWKQHPAGTSQLMLSEMDKPRTTHLLKRGDFLKPAEKVSAGVPAFLNPMPKDAPLNRLGLAKWMTSKDSPTTARAFVNRLWQAYFGAGLVGTPEDFGVQADAPTHPELLDWLACEFMEPSKGPAWSVKHLHRLIVTSATYRQSSALTAELKEKDPANKLLARGPRHRVDAEVVRDIALSVSGLLTDSVGGPPVYPPIPQFMTVPPASYGPKAWPESTGPDRYRRSLYVFKFRSIPYPALLAFDAPTGDFACVKRARSNSPVQALTGLNEPIFLEAAQALGLRILRDGGKTDAERVSYAFKLCVGRTPTDAEGKTLRTMYAKQVAKFSDPKADPWAVALRSADDAKKLPNDATPAQLAAWVAVARVLLNLDETISKE